MTTEINTAELRKLVDIKTWQERAKSSGEWPIFSGDQCTPFMKAEIAELRAYAERQEATMLALLDKLDEQSAEILRLWNSNQELMPYIAKVVVVNKQLDDLKAKLASQQGSEPVAWIDQWGNTFPLSAYSMDGKPNWSNEHKRGWKKLYTHPIAPAADKAVLSRGDAGSAAPVALTDIERLEIIKKVQHHIVDVVRSFGDISCAAYIMTWHKPEQIAAAIAAAQEKDNG